MNRLIRVETENIFLAWKHAEKYLNNALEYTPEYALADILVLLKSGSLMLWMFVDSGKKPFGAMVTEIIDHPRKRILNIFLLGSDNLIDCLELFGVLLEYAKANKVDTIEVAARFGWERKLDVLGFKKAYSVLNFNVE